MLISSLNLENRIVVTYLFNFYLGHGFQCTKIHPFAQHSSPKYFNKFIRSYFDASREGDEIPLSGVVMEKNTFGYFLLWISDHE